MARNSKNESGSRFASALAALALLLLLLPPGIGYVWFKDQNDQLGSQVAKQENALKDLKQENRDRRNQLANLCLPSALDEQVKRMNLGLGPPLLTQIVRLADLPAGRPAGEADSRRAQGAPRESNN